MSRWYRLNVDVRCGLCGEEIVQGYPVKVIEIATVRHPMFRGECCDGQAPAAVPHKFEPRPKAVVMPSFGTFTQSWPDVFSRIANDHKMSQAGRDPGEDDD